MYVIERKFAEQLDMTSDDVKLSRRSTPMRGSAGCSPS
jgi:hypothetical protein